MSAEQTIVEAAMEARARKHDPRSCACYSTTDENGVIHPVLCQAHRDEFHQALGGFHWVAVKYSRYFATEQDANDRVRIIRDRWPAEGYGTTATVLQISRWWLVRANWSSSCE